MSHPLENKMFSEGSRYPNNSDKNSLYSSALQWLQLMPEGIVNEKFTN